MQYESIQWVIATAIRPHCSTRVVHVALRAQSKSSSLPPDSQSSSKKARSWSFSIASEYHISRVACQGSLTQSPFLDTRRQPVDSNYPLCRARGIPPRAEKCEISASALHPSASNIALRAPVSSWPRTPSVGILPVRRTQNCSDFASGAWAVSTSVNPSGVQPLARSPQPRMNSPLHEGPSRDNPQPQAPVVVQIDPKWCTNSVRLVFSQTLLTSLSSLHSTLKDFFEPLRANDSRTDFFAIYRRESGEFDRNYAKRYDEDLNTSLIFVSRLISISGTRR